VLLQNARVTVYFAEPVHRARLLAQPSSLTHHAPSVIVISHTNQPIRPRVDAQAPSPATNHRTPARSSPPRLARNSRTLRSEHSGSVQPIFIHHGFAWRIKIYSLGRIASHCLNCADEQR
jgi:hypothetical protein